MEMFNPAHPGEILLEGYIKELGLSISKTALMIGVSRKHLSNIINCKVPITPEMALKIAKCFKTSPEIWLKEQMAYDLWQAKQKVNLDNIRVYG